MARPQDHEACVAIGVADRSGRDAARLEHMGRQAERARAAGVDVRQCGFLKKAYQRAPGVMFEAFNCLLAFAATCVSLGMARDALSMAAYRLKAAATGIALTPARDPVPVAHDFLARDSAGGSRVGRLIEQLRQARAGMKGEGARFAAVKAARSAFVLKSLSLAGGAALAGLGVAVTVLSGGAALGVVAAAVAGIVLYRQVMDTRCAWINRQRAEAGQALLPMGNNSLSNAVHDYLVNVRGLSDDEARLRAAKTSFVVSLATTAATVATSTLTAVFQAMKGAAAQAIDLGLSGVRAGTSLARARLDTTELRETHAASVTIDLMQARAIQQARTPWRTFLEGEVEAPIPDAQAQGDPDNDGIDVLSQRLARWTVLDATSTDDLVELVYRRGWIDGKAGAAGSDIPVNPGGSAFERLDQAEAARGQRKTASSISAGALVAGAGGATALSLRTLGAIVVEVAS